MIACRRLGWNFALDRAAGVGAAAGQAARRSSSRCAPATRGRATASTASCSTAWPSTPARLARLGGPYYPYVEPEPGAGTGLLAALRRARLPGGDRRLPGLLPAADGGRRRGAARRSGSRRSTRNGLLPLRAADQVYPDRLRLPPLPPEGPPRAPGRASPPRPPLRRRCPPRLARAAGRDRRALAGGRPRAARRRRRPRGAADRPRGAAGRRSARRRRGGRAGAGALPRPSGWPRYGEERNDPTTRSTSGLSPYLHFGHRLGARDLRRRWPSARAGRRSGWRRRRPAPREGWWGMSAAGRGVPRRAGHLARGGLQHGGAPRGLRALRVAARLGAGDPRRARRRPAARALLRAPSSRPAPPTTSCGTPPRASSRGEGRIHNYLRMLWGKKILAVVADAGARRSRC